jgi:hypothetical protein
MLELAMTAARYYQAPTIGLQHSQDVTNLHWHFALGFQLR